MIHFACPMIQCDKPIRPDDTTTGDKKKVTCSGCKTWITSYNTHVLVPGASDPKDDWKIPGQSNDRYDY